jgi:hypothetical protein
VLTLARLPAQMVSLAASSEHAQNSYILNLSLSKAVVSTCFKTATVVPVPKKAKVIELNDYRPVALTSVIMKCFE